MIGHRNTSTGSIIIGCVSTSADLIIVGFAQTPALIEDPALIQQPPSMSTLEEVCKPMSIRFEAFVH